MTKEELLTAALKVAERTHYKYMTRDAIGEEAGCPGSLVTYHLGIMSKLRRSVVGEAIRVKNWKVLGQALADGNPRVIGLKEEIKARL